MNPKSMNKLIERAKKDPKFFHSLVFDPEKVFSSLDYLDRKNRAHVETINEEEFFSHILGQEYISSYGVNCDNARGARRGFTRFKKQKEQCMCREIVTLLVRIVVVELVAEHAVQRVLYLQ